MVTGASTADLAVILIDARQGLLTQTRRHSYLVSLLGIRKVVVAINKLDLVDYSQALFERIEAEYRAFAAQIGLLDIQCIPLSALRGDNMLQASPNTPWYQGPSLLAYLEDVPLEQDRQSNAAFRLPVQWVNRPNLDFRGYCGNVVAGSVSVGERIRVLPSGQQSEITGILGSAGSSSKPCAARP